MAEDVTGRVLRPCVAQVGANPQNTVAFNSRLCSSEGKPVSRAKPKPGFSSYASRCRRGPRRGREKASRVISLRASPESMKALAAPTNSEIWASLSRQVQTSGVWASASPYQAAGTSIRSGAFVNTDSLQVLRHRLMFAQILAY